MKKVDETFVVLKGTECDAEKKRFKYLKTPIKGLYYVPSEIERKGRALLPNRFVPALLNALQKEKNMKLQYGVVTSAWNFGLTWRPVKFIEVFNNKKTFIVDFGRFAERYGKLHSYYSLALSKFYGSLSLKKIVFRKVALLKAQFLVYDDRYLPGFYIKKELIPGKIKKYMPKNAKKIIFLKNEYKSVIQDSKKIARK